MAESTDVGEFDRFVEHLPEDVARSIHFVPVKENKAADVPEEQDLKKEEFWLDLEGARERLQSGENVGPVLSDRLSVLILMDSEEAQAFLEDLPQTLEVSTRSEETHLYFLRGDGVESKDIPGIAELRTGDRYVVAPGSYASDGSGDSWGAYTVEEAREVVEITPNELPTELKPKKKLGKKENVNEHGWRIEKIREEDGVLDGLLTREKPPNLGFMSKEDADREAIEKLLYWEFSPDVITRIMKEYRNCGTEITSLSMEVLDEFRSNEKKVISDVKNVNTFRPGSSGEVILTRDVRAELGKEAFYNSKLKWIDKEGRKTEFITFLEDVVLPSGRRIEAGETRELLTSLADKLTDTQGSREIASPWAWECPSCGESYVSNEYEETPPCPNPNCDRKKMEPLHPQTEADVEKVLRSNYDFLSVRESNKPNKEPIIYIYSKGRYVKTGVIGLVRKKLKQMRPDSRPSFRSRVVSNIVDEVQILQEKFGAPKNKVVVENGILDLETLDLEDHSPDVYATCKINAPYDSDAQCPIFEQLVHNLIPKEKDRIRTQELLGTALVNEKLHKKAVVVVGPTDSGKSTFALIIRDIFGKDSTESETLKALADTRWAGIALLDQSLNIATEMTSGKITNLNDVKDMISGEPVKVEDKGTSKIEIEPYTEHLYCANQTPRVDRQAQAFWRRFFTMETGDSIPKDEQDSRIREKILKKERSGILNWLIEGYKRFVENGEEFTYPQEWTEARKMWLGWGDSVQRFIQNCVEEGPDERYTAREVYDAYLNYCDARPRLEADSQRNLTQRIKRTVRYATYSRNYRFDGVKKPGFEGIHISLEAMDNPSTNSLPEEENEKNKSLARESETLFQSCQSERTSGKGSSEPPAKSSKAGESSGKGSVETPSKRSMESSQQGKINELREIIRKIAGDYEGDIPVGAIVEEAKGEGIAPGFVEEFVERSLKKGELILTEKNGEKAVRLNE